MKKVLSVVVMALALSFAAGASANAAYNFANSGDWKKIDEYKIPAQEKKEIKLMFLKTVAEASFFNEHPVVEYSTEKDLAVYVDIIDQFYANEANQSIPLFFALRIADMMKKGAPEDQIQGYKLAVVAKLKAAGLLSQ